MVLSNLLPDIQQLSFVDKLRLIGILAEEVQQPFQEKDISTYFQPNQVYYIHPTIHLEQQKY
ncbi:MAG: hypothetical protein AAGI23_22445 [Bacteroidota bacterium]